jgi:hypothetical protein
MVVFSSLVSIRVDFVKFDSVSHRLSRAQGNGEKDLVIFLDFLGNLNLGFNVVVQSPAGLAEIRDVGHRLDVIIAPKQEMVADQQTLVLLKPFSRDPGVAKARVPTFLEYCGIPAPGTVNGIEQAPMEGVSFVYTFPRKTPTRRAAIKRNTWR